MTLIQSMLSLVAQGITGDNRQQSVARPRQAVCLITAFPEIRYLLLVDTTTASLPALLLLWKELLRLLRLQKVSTTAQRGGSCNAQICGQYGCTGPCADTVAPDRDINHHQVQEHRDKRRSHMLVGMRIQYVMRLASAA